MRKLILILCFVAIPARAELPDALLDLIVADINLPRAGEAYYHPLGRHPVTDAVLGDPLYLPVYGREVSAALRGAASRGDLPGVTEAAQRGAALPLTTADYLAWLADSGLDAVTVPGLEGALELQDARSVTRAWQLFLLARNIAERELGSFTTEEREWLLGAGETLFFGEEKGAEYTYFTDDTSTALKLFRLAARVDLTELARAQRCLGLAVELIQQRRGSLARLTRAFEYERDGLRLAIAGKGRDLHDADADFLIDCGGDDLYRNNAGGTGGARPAAFCIDLSGADVYEGAFGAQGAGYLGIGLLVDLAGDDLYQAGSFSQGAAFLGCGLLMDSAGNDEYRGDFFVQSAAVHGFSLLWDAAGHDRYEAVGFAQAASSTGGSAFLIESDGNDTMRCGRPAAAFWTRAMGIGQGGAVGLRDYPWKRKPSFYGGLAFLDDAGGDDDLWSVAFCQGGAYCLGTGLLINTGGDDRYLNRSEGHGAVVHLAAGLMIDEGGDDLYDGAWGSTGVGGDRGVGIFIDTAGRDRYRGGSHNLGSARKPHAFGLFADLAGDDRYTFSGESCGRVQRPRDPAEWPRALFLDLGGRDHYIAPDDDLERGDGLSWEFAGQGLGVDSSLAATPTEFFAALPARPRLSMSFDPLKGWPGNRHGRALLPATADDLPASRDWAQEIDAADFDERRALYEQLDLARWAGRGPDPAELLPALLGQAKLAPEDRLSYAAVWAELDSLAEAGPALAAAIENESAASGFARSLMIRALGVVGDPQADEILSRALVYELDPRCRQAAARALGQRGGGDNLAALADALEDPAEQVRNALAAGLRESPTSGALDLLRPLFADSSLSVRRQALLSAVSLGHKPAVGEMLDNLAVATLDTGENYGFNLFADLARYVGREHYERMGTELDAWREWWRRVGRDFDLPEAIATAAAERDD